MYIEIDAKSGFCFGVKHAIELAENHLKTGEKLVSLGEVVHNSREVGRLGTLGMNTVDESKINEINQGTVLIRTHGAPPSTYETIQQKELKIIDGTCPVVKKLQTRIAESYARMKATGGQVIIFGKKEHAEVTGLQGQANFEALVISSIDEIDQIDLTRPFELFTQTTMPVDEFKQLKERLQNCPQYSEQPIHDTICRQVGNRAPHLTHWATQFDIILFVSGKNSSNGKYLFSVCQKANKNSFLIASPDDINPIWFNQVETIGISGATSTPMWLMEQVKARIYDLLTNNQK